MSWMLTKSHKAFYFDAPKQSQICLEDIAHALSNLCRFNGHCSEFYSVAQHSVYASQLCPPEAQLDGLFHDATEAYIGDMVSPLKKLIPAFSEYEDSLWRTIAAKFSLSRTLPASVKKADLQMLATEARDLMGADPREWGLKEKPDERIKIVPWPPALAKKYFLERFAVLDGEYYRALMTAYHGVAL